MPSKYDPETRAKAVRLVLEHREGCSTKWVAIIAVSKRLGTNAETLRNWSRKQQVDDGQRDGITSGAAPEIKAPKRRNAELEHPIAILKAGNTFLRAGERPAQPPLTSSVCAFIAENKDRFGVAPICGLLTEHDVQIAPRTFYAWASRAPSERSFVEWDHHRSPGPS